MPISYKFEILNFILSPPKLDLILLIFFKLQLILDDPSGYSTVENLHLPFPDPKLEIRYYGRTKAQNNALGFYSEEDQREMHGETDHAEADGGLDLHEVSFKINSKKLFRVILCIDG